MLDLDNIYYAKKDKPEELVLGTDDKDNTSNEYYDDEGVLGSLLRNTVVTAGKGIKKALDIPKNIKDTLDYGKELTKKIPGVGALSDFLEKGEDKSTQENIDKFIDTASGTSLEKVTRPLREKVFPKGYEEPQSEREEFWQNTLSSAVGDIPYHYSGASAAQKGAGLAQKVFKPLFKAAASSSAFNVTKDVSEDLGAPPLLSNLFGIVASAGVNGFNKLLKKGASLSNKSLNIFESEMYNKATAEAPKKLKLNLPENFTKDLIKTKDDLMFEYSGKPAIKNVIKEQFDQVIKRVSKHKELIPVSELSPYELFNKENLKNLNVKKIGNESFIQRPMKNAVNIEDLQLSRKVFNKTINTYKGNPEYGSLINKYENVNKVIRGKLDNYAITNPEYGKYYNSAKNLTDVTNTQSYLSEFLSKSKFINKYIDKTPLGFLKKLSGVAEPGLLATLGYTKAGIPGAIGGAEIGKGINKAQVIFRQILKSPIVRARAADVFKEAAKQSPKGLTSALTKFDKTYKEVEDSTLIL